MPTFTAITLDRLLEPGASKSVEKPPPPKSKPAINPILTRDSKLERKNSTSVVERKVQRPQIKPALYATPETTPLPDSPSSFPPSPYIVNHKRRGPCLVKSFSEDNVASHRKSQDKEKANGLADDLEITNQDKAKVIGHAKDLEITNQDRAKVNGNAKDLEKTGEKLIDAGSVSFTISIPVEDNILNHNPDCGSNGQLGSATDQLDNGDGDLEYHSGSNGSVAQKTPLKPVVTSSESEDFFDPRESTSFTSNTDVEDNGAEHSGKLNAAEFFDAWEELSSEGGTQTSYRDVEGELREMRLSLLMEIEKRKQAEEALNNMKSQWLHLRQRLSLVGLTLPAEPPVVTEGGQLSADPSEDLCQQICIARFVSETIGRSIARAEMEIEMEAQIESKNFEIARLGDRLQYYEAVNHEMSQRNQEAIEMARRERSRRRRRQRWIWGSVAAAVTLGTAALAWSYLPSGKGPSSDNHSHAPKQDDAAP